MKTPKLEIVVDGTGVHELYPMLELIADGKILMETLIPSPKFYPHAEKSNDEKMAKLNAVVNAVNAHGDLVDVLRSIIKNCESSKLLVDPNSEEHSAFISMRDEARAALAKAEGR